MKPAFFATVLVVAAAVAVGAEVRIELPPETGTYRPGPGSELAAAHCLTCHSVEYTATQPPMDAKFWQAEVVKMKEKYGAPIPDDAVKPLTDYLTEAYGKK